MTALAIMYVFAAFAFGIMVGMMIGIRMVPDHKPNSFDAYDYKQNFLADEHYEFCVSESKRYA